MLRIAALLLLVVTVACEGSLKTDVDSYLTSYETEFQRLVYESQQAEWASNTHIVAGDSSNAVRTKAANRALLEFTGSVANIELIKGYLAQKAKLDPMQIRRLEKMLYIAAGGPQTVASVVERRIAAEADQNERLYGFKFTIGGREVSPNDIDRTLRESTDLAARRRAWEASKAVGPVLKPGIVALRDLRNQVVQALDYSDFFSYQVSDYGMTTDEMLALTDKLLLDLRPLYRELHTWTRYELARRYRAPVPVLLPADWLPNRWGQDWSSLVTAPGLNLDSALATRTPEWIVREGEEFYKSLGFPALPASFWERSSLYPVPTASPFKKNTHASAWHLDLEDDVRSLMSVENNSDWFLTSQHELGHVYYFMAYTNPDVPLVLREGANRAYHEAVGTMIGMASSHPMYLQARGLAPTDAKLDEIKQLLQEALQYVVFIPWSAGTMTRFEHSLYAGNLPADQFNAKWWELVARYQGIAPPTARGEEYADGLTKTHINDDPAQYYDYALASALHFQMHDHIARNILKQSPRNTNYFGSTETGDFLRTLMTPGSSRNWRDVLRETTGRELDGTAIAEYFQPLYEWLVEQNKGRAATLPE